MRQRRVAYQAGAAPRFQDEQYKCALKAHGNKVSQSHLDRAVAYVSNQTEHHGEISYQDEFRELLRRYEIDFDERYVWD